MGVGNKDCLILKQNDTYSSLNYYQIAFFCGIKSLQITNYLRDILNKPTVMTPCYTQDWHTQVHVTYQPVVSRVPNLCYVCDATTNQTRIALGSSLLESWMPATWANAPQQSMTDFIVCTVVIKKSPRLCMDSTPRRTCL